MLYGFYWQATVWYEYCTYFGSPAFRLAKSIVIFDGESAPLQQVIIFAVDFVLLRRPTIIVTMGKAYGQCLIEEWEQLFEPNDICNNVILYTDLVK